GPTEATIIASVLEVNRDAPGRFANLSGVPIGENVANASLLILDKYKKICPVNVPGELYIAGDGIAAGYLCDVEKTHHSFVNNIYQTRGIRGDKLYKTGDRVRRLEDGNIEFLGRLDFQVKIRGHRIELGEIENCLVKHQEVKEAVLNVYQHPGAGPKKSGEKYLCAYVVCTGSLEKESPVSEQLKKYLSGQLPEYMIPVFFTKIDAVPLNPNGKIDLKALPEPEIEAATTYAPPADETERTLTLIWSRILAIPPQKIGRNDDFFQLGGHSLTATILVNRIQSKFRVQLPLLEVFKSPTIAQQAGYVQITTNRDHGETTRNHRNLRLLRKKTMPGRQPVFFIHDGSGDVEGYLQLCNYLENSADYWGITADPLKDLAPVNITIEELAAYYVKIIKQEFPSGPYRICGWSIGGTIAFEMALQMEKMGETVQYLSLIDAAPPSTESALTITDSSVFTPGTENRRLREYLAEAGLKVEENIQWHDIPNYLLQSAGGIESIKKIIPPTLSRRIPNFQEIGIDALIAYFNIGRSLDRARHIYTPSTQLAAAMYCFSAQTALYFETRLKKHWGDYCRTSPRNIEIPGDHFSILKPPQVIRLAQELNKTLKQSENK
ncbi:MAG: AMP-binding protein, partial [bacterium]|nr:AMP-binding protein [bacterium]